MNLICCVEEVKKKLCCVSNVILNEIEIVKPITNQELEKIEDKLSFKFPQTLRDFYLNCSAGVKFSWNAEKDVFGKECISGELNILGPKEIKSMVEDMKSIVEEAELDKEEISENLGLQSLIDDWPHWIPIARFSNGDAFCIDKYDCMQPIVFLEHDVMDGGPNLHGIKIANDFDELMIKWSRICFVDIYDWTDVINCEGLDLSKDIFADLIDKTM